MCYLTITLVCASINVAHGLFDKNTLFSKPGDLMIAFVQPMSIGSKWVPFQGQNMVTFEYVMNTYGKDIKIPGNKTLTLGYVIATIYGYQDCAYDLAQLLRKYPQIVGVFGMSQSTSVMSMASILSGLRMPSFVTGSSVVSDYIRQTDKRKNVIALTATATIQSGTIIPRILETIGSDIINIICDSNVYSSTQLSNLLTNLIPFGINLDGHLMLPNINIMKSNDSYIDSIIACIKDTVDENRTAVIVSLAHWRSMTVYIEDIVNKMQGIEYKVLILSSSQGCLLQLNKTWSEHGVTVIRLCQTYYPLPELENKFNEVTLAAPGEPTNTLLYSYSNVSCDDLTNCSAFNDRLMEYAAIGRPYSSYNHRYYYSLRSFMHALRNFSSNSSDLLVAHSERADGLAQSNIGSDLMSIFKNISDEYEHGLKFLHGDEMFEISVVLDRENNSKLQWNEFDGNNAETSKVLTSYITDKTRGFRVKCSVDCVAGYMVTLSAVHKHNSNCWSCEKCRGNTYSNTINATQCTECPDITWTNMDRTNCTLTPTSIDLLHHTYGNIVLAFLILAFIYIAVTFALYLRFWSHKAIIASGRDLSVIMFLGMLCGLATAGLIASKPSPGICASIQVLAHLFIALILAPLFVRTLRIYVVFKFSVNNMHLVRFVRSGFCVGYTLLLSLPILMVLVFGLIVPKYRFIADVTVENFLLNNMVINTSCKPDAFALVYCLIAYIGMVLTATSYMGYDTRKIPDNFKESMHIFFCSLITLSLVGSSVPAMILLPGEKQVFSMALIVGVLSCTINAAIFTPKIYLCLLNPTVAVKKAPTTRVSEVEHSVNMTCRRTSKAAHTQTQDAKTYMTFEMQEQ